MDHGKWIMENGSWKMDMWKMENGYEENGKWKMDHSGMDTSVGARTAGALVDVGLAVLSGESCQAVAGVAVDAVDAGGAIAARIAEAFVDVVLAVASRRPRLTAALVTADEILAVAAELAGIRLAFVDLRLQDSTQQNPKRGVSRVAFQSSRDRRSYLAEDAIVAWMAVAREGIDAIDAVAMVARRALTIVDIDLKSIKRSINPSGSHKAWIRIQRDRSLPRS